MAERIATLASARHDAHAKPRGTERQTSLISSSPYDLARFADGIAALSLWGDCTMRFAPAVGAACERAGAARGGAAGAVTLALSGGDLLLMSHEARWSWTHEVVDVSSERRVSLTLRHLPPDG